MNNSLLSHIDNSKFKAGWGRSNTSPTVWTSVLEKHHQPRMVKVWLYVPQGVLPIDRDPFLYLNGYKWTRFSFVCYCYDESVFIAMDKDGINLYRIMRKHIGKNKTEKSKYLKQISSIKMLPKICKIIIYRRLTMKAIDNECVTCD